jgi:hypothetical protein
MSTTSSYTRRSAECQAFLKYTLMMVNREMSGVQRMIATQLYQSHPREFCLYILVLKDRHLEHRERVLLNLYSKRL